MVMTIATATLEMIAIMKGIGWDTGLPAQHAPLVKTHAMALLLVIPATPTLRHLHMECRQATRIRAIRLSYHLATRTRRSPVDRALARKMIAIRTRTMTMIIAGVQRVQVFVLHAMGLQTEVVAFETAALIAMQRILLCMRMGICRLLDEVLRMANPCLLTDIRTTLLDRPGNDLRRDSEHACSILLK